VRYDRETDILYAAARGWIDEILLPEETRDVLIRTLAIATRVPTTSSMANGVFQV
jgi:acetyl-CoA carboxylase carboxyltransferase component